MLLSKTFSALSDPNRQKIIKILKQEDFSAGEIASKLTITSATLSHHLDVLRKAKLVSSRRKGKNIFYSLNLSVTEELIIEITKLIKK